MNIAATCAGSRREGDDWCREDRMFTLGVSVISGYFTAHLETFSDAWMAYDLRGRDQAAVYAANAPRLRSALEEISSLVGEEVDPDDATWFGVPTESGVENRFEDDGSASDVWGSFELPYRKRVFQFEPKFGQAYRRTATGEIGYVEVVGGHGILGYLWVSDAEGAASYEPRDAAGDEAFESGVLWLKVLEEAKKSGLLPSQALAAASHIPEEPDRGRIVLETWRTAPDLASLRELAERDE
ncbi:MULTISPECIES: hypothetical protein [Streptomyces]|uniref:Uncharacterized protein n=1 Tax=Streptomyces ehimensis TaxID=68195 RepID=A0ABV9BKK1_9ACTN